MLKGVFSGETDKIIFKLLFITFSQLISVDENIAMKCLDQY